MSTTDKAREVLAAAATGLQALDTLAGLSRGLIQSSWNEQQVTDLLHGIVAVVESIQRGLSNNTSVDIDADLASLTTKIAQNNTQIDASIEAKFPTPA